MKIYEISCDICRDLIPLVTDGVASEDAVSAVKNHMEHCESCRNMYGSEIKERDSAKENRLVRSVKAIVVVWAVILVGGAVAVSAFLPYSRRTVALRVIALPLFTAFCCVLLGRKRIVLPAAVLAARMAVCAAVRRRDIYPGNFFHISAEEILSHLSVLVLCFAGAVIYQLVRFAVSQNKKD